MKKLMFALTTVLVLAACGKTGAPNDNPSNGVSVGNGFRLQMTADLSDAVSLATTLGDSHRLLKVTSSKKFAEVLSGPHEIWSWKETPTHIVAQVSISENDSRCTLIAIPKVRAKSQVLCLRRDDDGSGTYNYDVQGSDVYFTHTVKVQLQEGNTYHDNRITELRHWDGKSESVETIFHADTDFNKSPYINSVFTSETNENVCFTLAESDWQFGVTGATHGHLFCRRGAESPWEVMKIQRAIPEQALKFANHIMFDSPSVVDEQTKFDLATLTFGKRHGPFPMLRDFDLRDGGFLGRGDWRRVMGILICVDKNGDGKQLTEVNTSTNLVRIGDWAWFYGSQTLRRVSLVNCELDPKDYFPSTSLIQISSLNWALGDFVRLDGTNGRGMPSTVHLTPTGSVIRLETGDVKVNHPIELKWEM